MLFLVLRILPFFLPLLYAAICVSLFYLVGLWPWFFGGFIIFDIIYFLLLFWRLKKIKIFFIGIHSIILAIFGFIPVLLIGRPTAAALFVAAYAVIYFFYLESVFHYFYQTNRSSLLSLESVINYINLAAVFIGISSLLDFYIFVNFTWFYLLLIALLVFFILFGSRLLFTDLSWRDRLAYSFIPALVLVEILAGLMFWPTAFLVVAAAVSLAYYLLDSLLAAHLSGRLTKKILLRYSVIAVVFLVAIFATADWL